MKTSFVGFAVLLAFVAGAKSSKLCNFENREVAVDDSFDCQSFSVEFRFPWFPWHRFPILSTIWPILRPTTEEPSDHEECPDEGVIMIEHPDSCKKYIFCVHGHEFERSCAPGLHFSRNKRVCMDADEAGCDNKWECPTEDDLGNLVFIPNQEDCSKYYLCFGGDQIPLSCADGFHWSIEEERCLDKKKAGCEFEDDDDIESCPETGVKQISHPDNCGKFILCVGGNKFERSCPPNFHFSRKTRACEEPSVAGCKDSKLECPAEDNLDELVFLPSPDSCSKYYLCFGGEAIQLQCADGLHWSVEEQACLSKDDAGCELDDFEECPETGVKSISHPYNCEKYVLCVGGNRIKRNCGPGLHFSRNKRTCVQPNIAECKDEKYSCPEEDNLDELVFLPNTEDCGKYYVCFGGEPIPLRCGDGLHWSTEDQGCLAKNKANCEFGDGREFCPPEGMKQISHPDSCEKYFLCMGGAEITRNCSPGFHFSRDFRTCVPPQLAGCE